MDLGALTRPKHLDHDQRGDRQPATRRSSADLNHYLRATASYSDGHGPRKSAQAALRQSGPGGAASEPCAESFRPRETGARSVAEDTGAGVAFGTPVVADRPRTTTPSPTA